jgi:hypothetical protein
MSFTCLLHVRNEADIIAPCLQHLLQWAAIFGSVSRAPEIIS